MPVTSHTGTETASRATTAIAIGTILWFAGHSWLVLGVTLTMTGGVVSTTVTVKPPEAALPARSAAAQVTFVAPSGNVDPLAVLHATRTTPSTASVAVATKLTAAPAGPVASAVRVPGSAGRGGGEACSARGAPDHEKKTARSAAAAGTVGT